MDLSPRTSPRVTAAYALTTEAPKQKFTYQMDDSFEYAEEGNARFDEDVVNFECEEEVPPFREISVRVDQPETQFVPRDLSESTVENPFPIEEAEPTDELAAEKLPINEQLTHIKWQVRVRTYENITKCFETGVDLYSDREGSPYDHYTPWLKHMATDKNQRAQMEGLKALVTYIVKSHEMPQTIFLIAVDVLDSCPIQKPAYASILFQICTLLLRRDNDSIFLSELVKRVNSKRLPVVMLILKAVNEHVQGKPLSAGHSGKAMEAARVALLHSNNQVRAIGLTLCTELYKQTSLTKDSFLKGLKDVNPAVVKELSEALQDTGDNREELKYEIQTVKLPNATTNLLQFEASAGALPASADLRTLLHPKFAETAYISNIKRKKEVLLHLKTGLINVSSVSDNPENIHTLNLLLNYMDDQSPLIHSEIMNILELLIGKCPGMFASRWKQLSISLCERLKTTMKPAKMQVHRLLSALCAQKVVSLLDMSEVLVEVAKVHKNPQVREDALAWIALELGKIEEDIQREMDLISGGQTVKTPVTALSAALSKRLYLIVKTDVTGQVRDQAVKCLGIFLRLLPPETDTFRALQELVSSLPSARLKEMQQVGSRPSTAPNHASVSLLDMDLPAPSVLVVQGEQEVEEKVSSDKEEEGGNRLGEWVRRLKENRGNIAEFTLLLTTTGPEGLAEALKELTESIQWVLLKCGGLDQVSTVADACSYLSALISALGAFSQDDLLPLLSVVLMAGSFNVCTQNLLSTMDNLYNKSSKIVFLKGLIRTVLGLRSHPWTHLPVSQLLTVVRFSTQWISQVSRYKAAESQFKRAKVHECFQDSAYQQNYSEALLKEVEEFRTAVLAAEGENALMKATDILRHIRGIERLLKQESVEMRLSGLEEFLKLAKQLQSEQTSKLSARHKRDSSTGDSNPATQRGSAMPVLIVPMEELQRLVKTIGSGLNLAKSAMETDTYQMKTFEVIRTLRELISPTEAESLFQVLAEMLPVSPFHDSFNAKVYSCLSDWMAACSVNRVSLLISRHGTDPKLTIHLLRWLCDYELNVKEYQLSDLTCIALSIVTGLSPKTADVVLYDEDEAVYRSVSEKMLVRLMEKFDKAVTIKFFELQLVSCGRLFQEFAKWLDFKYPGHLQASVQSLDLSKILPISPSHPPEVSDSTDLQERFRLETIAHDQTQHLLEKLNADYLSLVTSNYQIRQELDVTKAENSRLQLEVIKLKAELAQQSALFPSNQWAKPITEMRELTDLRPESGLVTPRVDIFEPMHGAEAKFLDLAEDGDDAALCLFQYLLITSTNPGRDLTLPLLATFETLDFDGKIRLLRCVSASISQDDVIKSISTECLKSLFQFTLKYLSAGGEPQTVKELQHLLECLLDVTDRGRTLCALIIVLNEALPGDFQELLSVPRKAYIRLCVKCLLTVGKYAPRISGLFNLWLELYRLFTRHPPELLTVLSTQSECASLSDLEPAFKALRKLTDNLLEAEPKKALSFLKFILASSSTAGGSLYLRYVTGILDKRHSLRLSLS